MVKIIDTFAQINDLFEDGKFILDKWKTYLNSIYDNAANLVINDMKECLDSGDYVYEKDILPIINRPSPSPSGLCPATSPSGRGKMRRYPHRPLRLNGDS